jgi:myosin-crossreactive antigen
MKLGFMQKMALGKVMKAIEGTEVEKLLKEHKVI